MTSRYGAYSGGRDPLEEPFDVGRAMDELGRDVLGGRSPRNALDRLLHKGLDGRRGLDELRRDARRRAKELRRNNKLSGTLVIFSFIIISVDFFLSGKIFHY